jgi:hypothetical protein
LRPDTPNLQAVPYAGRTVTVKIKYATFQQITRSHSCGEPIGSQSELEEISLSLLRPYFPATPGVRLLGVTVSNLAMAAPQNRMQLALRLAPRISPQPDHAVAQPDPSRTSASRRPA